jgi:hypothetical protein
MKERRGREVKDHEQEKENSCMAINKIPRLACH